MNRILKQAIQTSIIILLGAALLLSSCRSSLASPADGKPSPPPAPGAREALVDEPVFNGTAYIFEAGVNLPVSVVLIHGLGDRAARDWEHLIPRLAERYHVVAFDLPGFGRSSKQNALYSPARYAEFVSWVVKNYVQGPFVIIGHSLGGAVALRYASTSPAGMQRLILVDVAGILYRVAFTKQMAQMAPRPWQSKLPGNPIDAVNDFVRFFLDVMDRESVTKGLDETLDNPILRKAALGSDPGKIAALALMLDDFSSVIDRVRTPTLILWGEHDGVAPLRTAKTLAGLIPDSRLEIIRGAGHVPMLEQTEQFNRIVIEEIAAPPLPSPAPPAGEQRVVPADRIGSCSQKDGMRFTGAYKRIEVKDCKHVEISNATAGRITVSGSEVVIENSRIIGGDVALKTDRSELIMTSVTAEGDVAVETSDSRLDLAGVKLVGRKAAVSAEHDSILIFSVSRVESPYTSGYLHGSRKVTAEHPL